MFVVYPDDEKVFEMKDQYFVGNSLLIKPIVKHLLKFIFQEMRRDIFQKFSRQNIRGSSSTMHLDPLALVIALNENSEAIGFLYLDDGETYDYEKGCFVYRQFTFSAGKLTSKSLSSLDNDKNILCQVN
ncbi:9610_t:CDS:2 [Cetraspora pellucida]|uniref:9610_t:CDS:1 n=1 Tax=Cetraspora pellucida TaxID=1433469 RepID=A0A9N9EC51_9GLOM|nr:9610_t:CDS:2 [Cetraspora pellucida]